MSYDGTLVVTPEDFAREIAKRNREKLDRIARSKSLNKQWVAHINGFDVDYTPNPAPGQDE